jgi:hypothetical protein
LVVTGSGSRLVYRKKRKRTKNCTPLWVVVAVRQHGLSVLDPARHGRRTSSDALGPVVCSVVIKIASPLLKNRPVA